MGAWGTASFENDDAMDWSYQLAETEGTSALREAFEAITRLDEDDYPEAPACFAAQAAAEVVAALKGRPVGGLPDTVIAWVSANPKMRTKRLTQQALNAIERIRENSEAKELWDEIESVKAWYAVLDDLSSRLSQ
jgi:hypothetical protein